jgi:predicted nucleic acid-binding protein
MIRSLVVDANFILKSVLPGPLRERIKALLAEWRERGVVIQAPALWYYEVASALSKGVHFKDFSQAQAEEMLALVTEITLVVIAPDAGQAQRAFDWTLRLRRAAAYDSFYLALAETASDGLWTADERLYNATKSLAPWVHWAGEPDSEGGQP